VARGLRLEVLLLVAERRPLLLLYEEASLIKSSGRREAFVLSSRGAPWGSGGHGVGRGLWGEIFTLNLRKEQLLFITVCVCVCVGALPKRFFFICNILFYFK